MDGKVVLVTGAGSGFGAETSALLASKRCKLSLVDKGCMINTLERCIQAGLAKEDILLIQADMTVTEELKTLPQRTVDYFGRLDVLVNNAGIGDVESLSSIGEEEYEKVMKVNCQAVFFLIQHSVTHLTKTKGNIVNVSSVFGLRPRARSIAYCVSKAAVNQITQCAALEFAPQQIRVNAVNPGHARTSLFSASGIPEEHVNAYLEEITLQYPLGRIAEPIDIAKAIAFLADNTQASFITGVCLPVDGGFYLGNCRN